MAQRNLPSVALAPRPPGIAAAAVVLGIGVRPGRRLGLGGFVHAFAG